MQESSPFKIYDASAGSGKTFTLVSRYLSILFLDKKPDAYQNILAITFMNKAKAEMKTRVIESLRAFSQNKVPEKHLALLESVKQQTGLSLKSIQDKSEKILFSILHNYAAFEISTIDGFTHRLLRTFAKDLNIPTNFEVEMDMDSILKEAVDRVIAKAGSNPILTNALVSFSLEKIDNDKSWDIEKDLFTAAKLLTNENNLAALLELRNKKLADFENFKKEVKRKSAENWNNLKSLAEEFFQLLEQNNLENKNFSRGSIPKYFAKLLKQDFPHAAGYVATWMKSIEDGPHYTSGQKDATIKSTMDALHAEVVQLFKEANALVYDNFLLEEVLKKSSSLSLLAAIQEEVEVLKQEYNAVLISEFNYTISKNIQNQPAPFIYERLGERYKHFFIDEFQDTSVLQWQNLIPLVGNQLEMLEGSLLLVGDVKQSIYRWRGGKAEQFLQLSTGALETFSIPQEKVSLGHNFRSLPEIIQFNNGFFEHAAQFLQQEAYGELFENAQQKVGKTEAANQGYVNISFLEAENAAEKDEVFPGKVCEIIKDLEEKGYAKKDICILVRNKKNGVAVANYLSQEGVPIISSETLLINNSPEVRFVTAVLQLSMQPQNKDLRFEVLDFIYNQQNIAGGHYNFVLDKLDLPLGDFFESLKNLGFNFALSHFYNLPLYDAAEYILRQFKLANTSDAYLQFYLDCIYEYSQKHKDGINGFLNYWEEKKDSLSIVAPEGTDAVEILTIHKSKGLEFPIVIYPYANEKLDDTSRDDIWINLENDFESIPVAQIGASKKLASYRKEVAESYFHLVAQTELDNLNLLYVTLTRAEQQLYIVSELDLDKTGNEKVNTFSGLLISYLKKLQLWEAEQTSYEFGELPSLDSKNASAEAIPENSILVSTAPALHSLEIVTKSGALWDSPQEEAITRGNLIHELLNHIHFANDLEIALNRAVKTGIILKEEEEQYRHLLTNLISHPDLKEYFTEEYEIFTEKEVLSEQQLKRLDRLCIKDNKATIIDYKTGAFAEKHKIQINQYAETVEKIGFEIDKKLLVYINEELTIKIV